MPGSTNWNRYPDFQSVQYGFESHTRYKMWMWCNGSHTWFRVKRPKGHMGSSPVIHTHIGRSSNRVRIPLWYSGNPGSSPGFPTKESSLTYWTHLELWQTWCMRWTENPEKVVRLHPAPPRFGKRFLHWESKLTCKGLINLKWDGNL